jgi:hypothetical protein
MTSVTLEKTQFGFLQEPVKAPAFSFFFRIHSGSEKQLHDAGHIRNRCFEVLKNAGLESSQTETLKKECSALIDALDLQSGAKSIGLFVSPEAAFSRLYYVNLPELFYMGERFSCYETMYAAKASTPYLLFLFEPSTVEIYKGQGNHLESLGKTKEVAHLLSVYSHRPTKAKDIDGKNTEVDHKWKDEFYKAWGDVMRAETMPAYAAGMELVGATTEEVRGKGINLYASATTAWCKSGPEQLKPMVTELRNSYWSSTAKENVSSIEAAFGAKKMVSSIEEIVDCARAGQAETLFLEEPVWTTEAEAKFTKVHEAMYEVLAHHGKVEFVPKGTLAKWQGAALVLRYC